MITDIPNTDDFKDAGLALINLAWDSVIGLAMKLAEAPSDNWGDSSDPETINLWKEALELYTHFAQRELATAVALAQQGTEFLLKSKIVEISPFLLISGSPSEWPKGCDKNDTSFADFKTIEAQDLVRAHDSVCNSRLTNEFKSYFEDLRRLRNTVMHTVDKRKQFTTIQGIKVILEVVNSLLVPREWALIRKKYLDEKPYLNQNDKEKEVLIKLAKEMCCVIGSLQPSDILNFFGFDKKKRRYLCPVCSLMCKGSVIDLKFSYLCSGYLKSDFVKCYVCLGEFDVKRDNCKHEGCLGNVVYSISSLCLTCGNTF